MNRSERDWGMACHLSALAGYIIPFGWVIGPLVVWLVKREDYEFVNHHGKEALNFQISIMIYGFLSFLLAFILIGIPLLVALGIFQIVMIILAAIKASNGEHYRYPLTIRFIK